MELDHEAIEQERPSAVNGDLLIVNCYIGSLQEMYSKTASWWNSQPHKMLYEGTTIY